MAETERCDMAGDIGISLTIVNAEALEAFNEALETIEILAEDQPWNGALQRCVTLLTVAANGLDIAQDDET